MKLAVELSSTEESNEFLRSLWAKMRATFDGIAWQYLPRRFGSRKFIRIGFASIPGHEPFQLGIHYKKRGVIDAIVFEKAPLASRPPTLDLTDKLKQCVLEAKAALGQTAWFHFIMTVNFTHNSRYNVALYEYEHFRIKPIKPGWASVTLKVAGYDGKDAEFVFRCKNGGVLDLLSAWTNLAWLEQELEETTDSDLTVESNAVWADNEWLDDVPVENGHLCITRDQAELIDRFVEGKISFDDDLVRAAHLSHKAVRLARFGSEEDYDLATALFVSALEVVSLERSQPERCDACGQLKYGISQRIVQLAVDTLGPNLADFFRSNYDYRSKYLHRGLMQSHWPWGQPLIDLSAEHDVSSSMFASYPHNLLEFTSFILRRACLDRRGGDPATGSDLSDLSGSGTAPSVKTDWTRWFRRLLCRR